MKSLVVCLLAVLFVACEAAVAQRTEPYQHMWEVAHGLGDIWREDEELSPPPIVTEGLTSKELSDQVRVAQEICRLQHPGAVVDNERIAGVLRTRLEQKSLPVQAQRAFASALLLLSEPSDAEFLWNLSASDLLLRSKVESQLAKWKSPVALDTWRTRLRDENSKPKEVAMALEGLAAVGNSDDNQVLERVLRGNATTNANRILAADVLGRLNTSGLNPLAKEILASDAEHAVLIAVHLIKQHTGDETLAQLQTAYDRGSNVAQLLAAQALFANFRDAARELAPKLVEHPDTSVRMLAAEKLKQWDDDETLRLQTVLLSDRSKAIRRLVGAHFLSRAKAGQRSVAEDAVTYQLNSAEWQGLEQAIILAVHLDDRSRCARFLELIEHQRPEVHMCAAWGLMELAEEPAHFVAMQAHVRKVADLLATGSAVPPIVITDLIRIGYLMEAFGRTKYEPALDLLMEFVPKNDHKYGHVSRASAIWALGELFDGKDNASLRATLCERLLDNPVINPEDYLVRVNSALALGQMAYEDSSAAIQKFNDRGTSPLSRACAWAIDEIQTQNEPK